MVRVHFTVVGLLPSFAEDLPSEMMGADDSAIKAELNKRVVDANVQVDGKHPPVDRIFFIYQLPNTPQ